jgi:hypothetical protein
LCLRTVSALKFLSVSSNKRLLEKLKGVNIDSFSTVEHIFKIEFGENKQDEVKFEYNYEALERIKHARN